MKPTTFAVDIDGTITENGDGRLHLGAFSALRQLCRMKHEVIFVSGRSSVEGFMLSVFGGTTKIAVGENGGCITTSPTDHILLGDRGECEKAFDAIRSRFVDARTKPVFPRLTEVVLERNFDIDEARDFAIKRNLGVELADSGFAFHINSRGVDKGSGFKKVMEMRKIAAEDVIAIGDSATDLPLFEVAGTSVALSNASNMVQSRASIVTRASAGDGLVEAIGILAPRISCG